MHTLARHFALLLAALTAATATPSLAAVAQETPPKEDPPQETGKDNRPPVELIDLDFDDALSRAERLQKQLVVYWFEGPEDVRSRDFRNEIFGDPAVQRWIAEKAVAVRIDAKVDVQGARANLLRLYPTIDLFDVRRGARVQRLIPGYSSADLLAIIYGSEDGLGPVEKPTGDDATEPYRWLAWANASYAGQGEASGPDATEGYRWCLLQADQYRPEFRARFLEFLLKRISTLKLADDRATRTLRSERDRLARRIRSGTATRRETYELTRLDFWLNKDTWTRDLFLELDSGSSDKTLMHRRWLFFDAVPVLGRFQNYDAIMRVVGDDPMGAFEPRIAAERASAATAGPEAAEEGPEAAPEAVPNDADAPDGPEPAALTGFEPMTGFVVPDRRVEILEDASWVYEALLATGRGADARAFLAKLSETYPTAGLYGRCMERALRLEMWAIAAEVGDIALGTVDERGQRRIRRLMNQIPADDGASSDR